MAFFLNWDIYCNSVDKSVLFYWTQSLYYFWLAICVMGGSMRFPCLWVFVYLNIFEIPERESERERWQIVVGSTELGGLE